MEDIISIKELVKIIKKRSKMISVITISVVLLTAIFTFFIITPQYQTSTQILVNQAQNSDEVITTSELQSNVELINTYNVIMTSPIILEKVIEAVDPQLSIDELQNKITVTTEEQSQVVVLSIEDESPTRASELANEVAFVFEQEIPNIMNIDNVSVLSESQLEENASPVSPQPFLNLIIAFFVGSLLGIAISFLIEFLDQTIKTEQDVEKNLNLAIIGSVSVIEQELLNENSQSKNSQAISSNENSKKKSRKTS